MLRLALLLSLGVLALGVGQSAPQTFQNPVIRNNFPDPFVLEVDGTYYAYATNGASKNVQLSTSPDLVSNDTAWEGGVVEAPTMWLREGEYYLFFSANSYAGHEYAVGYARCETALGPCQDAPENPILKSRLEEPFVIGPGHQTLIQDDDGDTWMVYHVWQFTGGLRGDSRFVWLDQLVWQDGKPVVAGPTSEPQERP